MDRPYSQESNIGWICGTVNTLHPRHSIILSFSSNTHPVSKKYHTFTSSFCLGFHRGFWVTSLMSRLSLPSQDVSCFLQWICPSWTGLSTLSSFTECVLCGQVSLHTVPSQNGSFVDQSPKLSTTVLNAPWWFWQSPFLQMQYHASMHSQ